MKALKLFILSFIITAVFADQLSAALKQTAKVHKLDKNTMEVIVSSPRAVYDINMGDKLFVIIDEKPIIMSATFPMMTIAKCRLDANYKKYFNRIQPGMPVYKYRPGIESEITKKDSLFKKKTGNSAFKVTASKKSKIFVINQQEWDEMLRSILEKDGKRLPDQQRIVDVTIDAIVRPDIRDNQITLSALVYVLGMTNKDTPSVVDQLPAGTYYVWVMSDDMVSYQTVVLKNNETKPVHFNVENKYLSIDSSPSGASIYIDGILQSQKTPAYSLKMPVNKTSYMVTLNKDGYESSTQYVSVVQGQKKNMYFTLKQKPASCCIGGKTNPNLKKYAGGNFGLILQTGEYDDYLEYTPDDLGVSLGVEAGIVGGNCLGFNLETGYIYGMGSYYTNNILFGGGGLGFYTSFTDFFMYFGGEILFAATEKVSGIGYGCKFMFGFVDVIYYSVDWRYWGNSDFYASVISFSLGIYF